MYSVKEKNMGIKELKEYKTEILRLAFKCGVKDVEVFGSVARNEYDTNSDIDFLVEMQIGKTLLDRLAFKNELEALLG